VPPAELAAIVSRLPRDSPLVITSVGAVGCQAVVKARPWHRVAYLPVVRVRWRQTHGRTLVSVVCHAEVRELLLLFGSVVVFAALGIRAGEGILPILGLAGLYHTIGMFSGFWPGCEKVEAWVRTLTM
jgi:hypothetical protein